MLRVTRTLLGVISLVLAIAVVTGCSPNYRSGAVKSNLDYWVPQDPWQNQKEGYCCFVYKDPPPEEMAVAARRQQPAQDLENTRAGISAQQQEITMLRQQLQASQAANAALERDKSNLAKQLDAMAADRVALATQLDAARSELAARADSTLRLTQESIKIDQGRQLQASQTALASTAAVEKENDELAKKLEETRAALAQKAAREAELERSIKSMEQALKTESGQQAGSIRRNGDSFTVELADRILFDSGSAKVSPRGLKVVKRIADSLQEGSAKTIRIEGHTDDVPIRKSPPPRFHSNWELSAARAGNVAQYLESNGGIKPEQLSAAGYSFTRPHVPNQDRASRALNRRVEITVMPAPPAEAMLRRN